MSTVSAKLFPVAVDECLATVAGPASGTPPDYFRDEAEGRDWGRESLREEISEFDLLFEKSG